jgi:hypothetical protein
MTFHTTDIVTSGDLNTGWEHHGCLGNGAGIVASHTLNTLGISCGNSGINFASFGAIQAEEILITCASVTLGAGGRDTIGVLGGIIPVAERFSGYIIVAGALPFG